MQRHAVLVGEERRGEERIRTIRVFLRFRLPVRSTVVRPRERMGLRAGERRGLA